MTNNNSDFERIVPSLDQGLTSEQVEERHKRGFVNKTFKQTTKSYWEIIANNVFTFFNILLIIIAVFEIIAGNAEGIVAFMTVLVANLIIGVVQDIRAKKLTEKLKISTEPHVFVIRDGVKKTILSKELVIDDLFYLETGNQISVDGIVKQGEIEVDESILTGEPLSVKKNEGDTVYSGSFVISGKALVMADKVGKNSFAQQIQAKAKQFKRPKSELLKSINKIFRMISFVIIPLGLIMFYVNYSQALLDAIAFNSAVIYTSAAMIGMIPSGMFLCVSMTLAVGVLRLGKKKTMVQELYSIEMLARSNVLCFDKTGTLTDGTMRVEKIISFEDGVDHKFILGNLLNATKDNNQTALAIMKECPLNDTWKAVSVLPFSSKRKLSAATFENKETYILGALEFVTSKVDDELAQKALTFSKQGCRVVALAKTKAPIKDDKISSDSKVIALIIIKDNIRPNAVKTIEWFKSNGVEIKIISGDNPITVSEIARQCGVNNYDKAISLEGLSIEEVKRKAIDCTVFGRVSPEQKAAIVEALKENGKTVAMTGDGVNDVIALKKADCSIAMASGADATKCSSHLVLMDSDFSHMPEIVEEGRRVVNNLQQTCSLYLTKTIFAFLTSLVVLILGLFAKSGSEYNYPYVTQHLYIWEFCGIGISSFFLSLQPNNKLIEGGFVNNVIAKALPGGISIALLSIILVILKANGVYNNEIGSTMGMIAISVLCFVVLARCCFPFNKYRLILFIGDSLFAIISYVTLSLLTINHVTDINFFMTYPELLTDTNWVALIGMILVFGALYFILDLIIDKTLKRRMQK